MYSDRWSPGLRQGDVIGEIFFPALGAEMQTLSKTTSVAEHVPAAAPQNVLVKGDQRHAIVISHDCEFNENKRNRLLLARLEDVPGNLDDAAREALRASNNVEARSHANQDI